MAVITRSPRAAFSTDAARARDVRAPRPKKSGNEKRTFSPTGVKENAHLWQDAESYWRGGYFNAARVFSARGRWFSINVLQALMRSRVCARLRGAPRISLAFGVMNFS